MIAPRVLRGSSRYGGGVAELTARARDNCDPSAIYANIVFRCHRSTPYVIAVYRGGSWRMHLPNMHAAERNGMTPIGRSDDLGLRAVRRRDA